MKQGILHLLKLSGLTALGLWFVTSQVVSAAAPPPSPQQMKAEGIYFIGNGDTTGGCGTLTSESLVGNDNEQKAYNFFIQQGLSNVQSAAVVGNLMDESHLDPTIIQNGGDSQNPNDAGKLGWGIAQWTPGGKVIDIAKNLNITGPIYDLATQLNIVWGEMTGTAPTGYHNVASGLKQINDLSQAVTFFQVHFESGDPGSRQEDAQQVFQQYGGQAANSGTTVSDQTTSSCSISCSTLSNTTLASDTSSSGLSSIRQNVVCLAQQELALWQSQSGYPWKCPAGQKECTNTYSESGYLKYSQNSAEEWCADFVSWIYNEAGYPLQTGNNWRVSAVVGVQAVGQAGGNFHWHPKSENYVPKPGDIAIRINTAPNNTVSHTNIFVSASGNTATYIGGDQGHGPYPGGSIVSIETGNGYYDGDIIGYVTPD